MNERAAGVRNLALWAGIGTRVVREHAIFLMNWHPAGPLFLFENRKINGYMHFKIRKWFCKTSTAWILVYGFLLVILAGTILLWLPVSHNPGVRLSFLDALFESTSAVCVTGLTVVSPGDTFNLFGRFVLGILIQIGGMGVVLLGIMLIRIAGGRLDLKMRSLFVAAQNLTDYYDLPRLATIILRITFTIEGVGAFLLWFPLMRYFDPLKAAGHAIFLAVSAFNNAGFDVFRGSESLIPYAGDAALIMIISLLVILGGFGFIAMCDLFKKRFHWRKLMLTTKVAVFMTVFLLFGGMVLFLLTTDETPLEAWFQSVITRTAGFASYPLSQFSQGALLIFIILMFIGASPNSTGGGIKTTTAFMIALKAISSGTAHDEDSVFHRRVPSLVFDKAFTVLFYGLTVVLVGTVLLCLFESGLALSDALAEVVSAFATVGSSTGITSSLGTASRIVLILTMFTGRLGPVTIANLLVTGDEKEARYTEENVLIG